MICDNHSYVNFSEKTLTINLIVCLFTVCSLCLGGCDKTEDTMANKQLPAVPKSPPVRADAVMPPPQTQFTIGNKSYLFDVSDHSFEELDSLLKRAQEISQFDKNNFEDLEIVMILHGPDIEWFTRKNYEKNQQLIDLAARLDALDIIDMKVCESAMNSRGVKREEIPAFIESVPYAPDELKRLAGEGYINL
jgi:uncharacterized protein